jgi:hypothetical protein
MLHKNGCVVWPFEQLIQVTQLDEPAGLPEKGRDDRL